MDLLGVRLQVMSYARRPPEQPLDIGQMADLIGPAAHVLLFPRARCHPGAEWLLPVALAAAAKGATLNTGWLSRSELACPPPSAEITASDPSTSAYVFFTGAISHSQALAMLPAGVHCRTLADWVVCRVGLEPAP